MTDQKLHFFGAVDEVIPALLAIGMSPDEIRAISKETGRRMGEGGPTRQWVLTMGDVIAETGNRTAMAAYTVAIEKWLHS